MAWNPRLINCPDLETIKKQIDKYNQIIDDLNNNIIYFNFKMDENPEKYRNNYYYDIIRAYKDEICQFTKKLNLSMDTLQVYLLMGCYNPHMYNFDSHECI